MHNYTENMSRVQNSRFERPATGRSTRYFSLQYGRKLNEIKSAGCYCVKMTDMPVYSDRVRLTGATERYVKAGRTLEDLNPHFKADLHPLIERGVARFASYCKRFFVQKSSIVWCHYDYLSAPHQDGAFFTVNQNVRQESQLTTSSPRFVFLL